MLPRKARILCSCLLQIETFYFGGKVSSSDINEDNEILKAQETQKVIWLKRSLGWAFQ